MNLSASIKPQKHVIFIDTSLPDYQILIGGLSETTDVVQVTPDQDGIQVMAEWAQTHSGYSAMHIVGHGSEGAQQLGNATLSNETLETYQAELTQIGKALTEDGDILLYGCETAQGKAGQQFLNELSAALQHRVAASVTKVGHTALGGSWELQYFDQEKNSAAPVFATHTVKANWEFTLTVADENYEDDTTDPTVNNDGWTYISNDSGTPTLHITTALNLTGNVYSFQSSGANNQTEVAIKTTDGSEFKLNSFNLGRGFGSFSNLVIKGLKDGIEVASSTPLTSGNTHSFDVSANTDWQNIDEIRISGDDLDLEIDDIDVSDPVQTNTSPTIVIDGSALTYTENDNATRIDAAATLSDSDGDADWDGGTLVAQITANNEAADELSIADTDGDGTTITVSGTDILANGTDIGDLSSSGGTVTNGTALTITFNSNATNTAVQEVLQSLRYRSTSEAPGTDNRTITITATDKNSGSDTGTRTVQISAINDAPTLTSSVTTA